MDNLTLQTNFKRGLKNQDLAEKTIIGYAGDVHCYLTWLNEFYQQEILLLNVKNGDIQAYREYLSKLQRQRSTSINRRLLAIKRFYSWAVQSKYLKHNPAEKIRFARRSAPTKPQALHKKEIHTLLTCAGQSKHGLAARNYALVQLFLQTGLRVGEVSALQIRDVSIHERTGIVRVINGKGNKQRDVPLNAIVRRALKAYLKTRGEYQQNAPLFMSKQSTPATVRAIQHTIHGLGLRANIARIPVSCHALRHTFATEYLQANPGSLVELAMLLGHNSIHTTAIYTKASKEKLVEGVEKSGINIYGTA